MLMFFIIIISCCLTLLVVNADLDISFLVNIQGQGSAGSKRFLDLVQGVRQGNHLLQTIKELYTHTSNARFLILIVW